MVLHKNEIKSLQIAPNGKYVLSCSADTDVKVWSIKGNLLETIDTKQFTNYMGCISPSSQFFAVCAFTTDVRILEVVTTKTGEFEKTTKCMNLKGHKVCTISLFFLSK